MIRIKADIQPTGAIAGTPSQSCDIPGHAPPGLPATLLSAVVLADVGGPIRERVIRKQRFGETMAHGGRGRGEMKHGGETKKTKPQQ